MTTTYAPLFDDADLSELARQLPVEPAWIEYQRRAIRQAPAWTGYPTPDITTRIIHDRQFMDLSERYDPTEPTDDEASDGTRPIWFAAAAVVALQIAVVILRWVW